MTIVDQINNEFARIIGTTEDGYMLTATSENADDLRLVIVSSNLDTDDSYSFVSRDLLEILNLMPDGCPIEEGEDGSLWEVLLEYHMHGSFAALRYVKEHHV